MFALSCSISPINIGTDQRGRRPPKNSEDFQKGLDAISRFAAKGSSPDDVCTRTRDVKKQINPPIKAHLLRSALILFSLVAICAIPFALAQRNAAKPSISKPATQPIPAAPRVPDAILYDQLNSPGSQSTRIRRFLRRALKASTTKPRTTLSCPSAKLGRSPKLTYRACILIALIHVARPIRLISISTKISAASLGQSWHSPVVALVRSTTPDCSKYLFLFRPYSFCPWHVLGLGAG